MTTKKVMLLILDGWGIGPVKKADAIANAHTPVMDSLKKTYPNSTLVTYGEEVGLPKGQMGNSEVGHMNIGAGRIVYQELLRINKAIQSGELQQHPVLLEAFRYAKENNRSVHFMGLVSDGGVHSHIDHLLALCDIAQQSGLEKVFIHAFTDGRDTDPKSGVNFLEKVLQHTENQSVKIASCIGRYYAMDRDKRWDRIKTAYDLLVKGKGEKTTDILATVRHRYEKGETDEYL
ncbi:MAG TPA: 2,3-bisphosphoglycerate-independent phosphoglycerate mutase, partial [Bacteroidetes bacterium]|nr:2,3-bisphosphoglycerate-independent phosphoglycerate mutase [Bacteroidota bacterium]